MKGNLRKIFITNSLLICVAVVLVMGGIGTASPETVVTVSPKIYEVAPGESFNVTITVTDVADLYSYDANMTFNPTVLNCTGVTEGPFLEAAGTTWWMDPDIRNDKGYVLFGNSLFIPLPPEGATGNGVLAKVTFKVLAEGATSIHFSMTALNTLEEGTGVSQPIQHTAVDGAFAYPMYHDLAVTNVSVSPASVPAGELISINVTVENEGNVPESFNVTVYYDNTAIQTLDVINLPSGNQTILAFTWDTIGVAADSYTIKAETSSIPGEDNTANNVGYADQEVTVELVHDVAVMEVVPSSTSVPAGETVSINVTVRNEGSATETFDVTITYDSTDIETRTATDLAPGDSETLAFNWNTGDVNEGNYTITATASTVSGETEIEDNTNSEVTITVTAPLPSLIPVEFVVGIIIVLVAVVALIFLYARRKSVKT
ncbi:MAG: cohesin domain-containing protein [Candidatus Bathyarchaeota archaeon]|jgi:hypothetical protein